MTAYYNENDPHAAAWLRQLIKQGAIAYGDIDDRSITEVQPQDLAGYTQHHFFAGIGGWSFALRLAGWPDDKSVWTGSCPCPPFSVAGKKKACPGCQSASLLPHPYQTGVFVCCDCGHEWHADHRHLWPEFHRLIENSRPAIVFGEQVAGADGEVWLSGVRATLEILGYGVGAANIGAHSAGGYHQRQRLYWMAHCDDIGCDSRMPSGGQKARSVSWIDSGSHVIGLADTNGSGSTTGRERCTALGYGQAIESDCCVGILGDASSNDKQWQWQSCSSDGRQMPSGGPSFYGDVVYASGAGLSLCEQKNISGSDRNEERRTAQQSSVSSSIEHAYENLVDWRSADWITCRDSKWRAVEPGSFPLVDGISNGVVPSINSSTPINANQTAEASVMRLKGYGNAIVPQVAAEFIAAFCEVVA